jgi:hypothetical protein
MTGENFIDTLLAVGKLESDRAAARAMERRVQEAQIARSHGEELDMRAANALAEHRMARIIGLR